MRSCLAFVTVFASLFASAPAFALSQPGSDAGIPSQMGCNDGEPTGLEAVMACACKTPATCTPSSCNCNIGAPCPGGSTTCDPGTNNTCETTLWHYPNDNGCIPSCIGGTQDNPSECVPSTAPGLDVATQAAITPETFHPTCGQAFTVISRGTAMFQDIFGWYNATTNDQPPDPSDLHVMVGCTDGTGFTATLDLATAPGYKGGDIGFFLISPEDHAKGGSCAAADGGADCCPSVARFQAGQGYVYYSQRELNPDNSPPPPYFHLLILPSDIFPERYYFAWEDTFHTTSSDFTDIVVAVDGVQCSGAGVPCNTGKKGACAMGVIEVRLGGDHPDVPGRHHAAARDVQRRRRRLRRCGRQRRDVLARERHLRRRSVRRAVRRLRVPVPHGDGVRPGEQGVRRSGVHRRHLHQRSGVPGRHVRGGVQRCRVPAWTDVRERRVR